MIASRASGAPRRGACALVCAAIISSAETGSACSCGEDWDWTDADVIFQGEAVEVHEPLHLTFTPSGRGKLARTAWQLWFQVAKAFDHDVRTVFEVKTAWKGAPPQFVTVNTGSGICCDCSFGHVFKEGRDYVVFAAKYDGELNVGACAGSAIDGKVLPPAEAAELGPGTRPSSGVRGLPLFWRHLSLPVAMVLAITLAGFICWRFSESRRRESTLG